MFDKSRAQPRIKCGAGAERVMSSIVDTFIGRPVLSFSVSIGAINDITTRDDAGCAGVFHMGA